MSSRSYIIQCYCSCTVYDFCSVVFISNFNCYVTGSVVWNNYHDSTVSLVNDIDFRSFFGFINCEIRSCVITSIIIITIIFDNDGFRTSSQVFNFNSGSAVYYFCSVFLTVNGYGHIACSVFRNFNGYCYRFALFSLTYSDINRSFVFRSCDISICCSISVSVIT